MTRRLLTWALVLMVAVAAAAQSTVKPREQRVYMFGVAASMTDSVSYITDLQLIDAYVMPNGFLADRSLYALQLNNFIVANQGKEDMTCVVFFSKSKSKAEKKFQKVRKKYRQNPAAVLQPLGVDLFRFEHEEWVNPIILETPSEEGGKVKK